MNLRLDWCSHKASKYAVMNWHYSKKMPVGKIVKIGVWENYRFIGAILFSHLVGVRAAQSLNMTNFEVCELVRVALDKHKTPTTRIMAVAVKMLKTQSPDLGCIVSFADPSEGHLGTIYQAGNWLYLGQRPKTLM